MAYPNAAYTHSWAYNNPSVVIEHGDGTLTMYKTFNSSVKFYNLGTKLGMDTTTAYYMFTFNGTSWSSHTTKTATGSTAPYTTEINIADIDYNSVRIYASGGNEEILPNPFAQKPSGFYNLPSGINNYYMIAEDGSWTVYYTDKVFYVTSGVNGVIYLTESSPHTYIKLRKWNLGDTSWGAETNANTTTYTNNTLTRRVVYNSSDRLIRYTSTVGLAAIPFEEPSNEVENYDLVGSISQSSSVVGALQKSVALVGSITQSSTVSSDIEKVVGDNYNLVGAISQSSTVASALTKVSSLNGEISQTSEVSTSVAKESSLNGSIAQSSEVSSDVTKQVALIGAIEQSSTVDGSLAKTVNLVGSIEQTSEVSSALVKEEVVESYNLVSSISQSSTISSTLAKHTNIVGSVEQSSFLESNAQKLTALYGSIVQPIELSSLANKTVGLVGAIEQLSELSSVLRRISASRLTSVIRVTVSPHGTHTGVLQFKETIEAPIRFRSKSSGTIQLRAPIRKVVKI